MKLEALGAAAAQVIPDLEREYEQIMAELEREQAEVAEIEACDQDYLNELKASIAEQKYAPFLSFSLVCVKFMFFF